MKSYICMWTCTKLLKSLLTVELVRPMCREALYRTVPNVPTILYRTYNVAARRFHVDVGCRQSKQELRCTKSIDVVLL
jgi:hypothetical protein